MSNSCNQISTLLNTTEIVKNIGWVKNNPLPSNENMKKTIILIILFCLPAFADSSKCRITSADNPNINYLINPNVTYKYNPDVTYSINPNVTYRLNPTLNNWNGYYVCNPSGQFVGASVIANSDVMVLFSDSEWTGHFVTNKKGGYNFFNRDNEWKGFLVPTKIGGFVFFNRDKEWVLSLISP